MTRPACATSIMAGLGALVRSGLVDRGDALRAVGAFDTVEWRPGTVESRDGKARYTGEEVQKAPPKEKKPALALKKEIPVRKGKETWIPTEAELF